MVAAEEDGERIRRRQGGSMKRACSPSLERFGGYPAYVVSIRIFSLFSVYFGVFQY